MEPFGANKWQWLKLAALILLPIFLMSRSVAVLETKPSLCLFKMIFGRPCFGCGMMKAAVAALHGDLVTAWHFNRLTVIVLPLAAYCWTKELIKTVRRL